MLRIDKPREYQCVRRRQRERSRWRSLKGTVREFEQRQEIALDRSKGKGWP